MANTMRWRYGETNPVVAPVDSSTVIEIGDLLFLEGGNAKPAAEQEDEGSQSANQSQFHYAFLGVAMQSSSVGETAAVRVATTGVFEYDSDPGAYDLGDFLGAKQKATGDGIESQQLARSNSAATAIGRSVASVNLPADRMLVEIVSSAMRGGVKAVG